MRNAIGVFSDTYLRDGIRNECLLHTRSPTSADVFFNFCLLRTRSFSIELFEIAMRTFEAVCMKAFNSSHILQCVGEMVTHMPFLCSLIRGLVVSK